MKSFIDLVEEITEEEFETYEFTEEEWNKLSEEERDEFEEAANGGAVWHVGDEDDSEDDSDIYEASGGKEAYQKFVNTMLKKFGVKSPSELEGDKKKEFYDALDAGWEGDDEEPEPEDKKESIEFDGEAGEKTFGDVLDEIKRYVARNTNKRRLTQRKKDLNKFKDRSVKRMAKIDRRKAGNRVKRVKLRKKWIRRNKVKIRNANKVYGGKVKSKFTK
jgi:hypothetical protein